MRARTRPARTAAIIIATLAAWAVPGATNSWAKQELTVSPTIIELSLEAGDSHVEQVTATASGDEAITVELVHADFGFGDDYAPVLISDEAKDTTSFSTRGWFSLPKERYRIPAGQSRQLSLTIDVPRNTPGGTYLGAALLRIVPPDTSAAGSQVQAVAQSGPLVFIAVDGGAPPKPKLTVRDVSRFQTAGPIRPEVVVSNGGDEFFMVEGKTTLTGPGRDRTVEFRRQVVMPDDPRTLKASAPDRRSDVGAPRLGTSHLGFGRYTLTTELKVDPTGAKLTDTRTVWIVPTWAWLLAIAVLVLFAACAALVIRWFLHRDDEVLLEVEHEDEDSESEDDDLDDDSPVS